MNQDIQAQNEMVKEKSAFVDVILSQMGRVIVGQRDLKRSLLIGLMTGGHVLLEGVPGLAKTLIVKTLADCINTGFRRIQFTPDLLPADLIGTMIYNTRDGEFQVKKGPIFSNIILADEINRAPAKVQSALLEAMQEKQVTISDQSYSLTEPFLVMATQNPIEQEGTYPLPEAQVDRFMLKCKVDYPSKTEEIEIVNRMTTGNEMKADPVVDPETILESRKVVNQIYIDEKIISYITDLVFASRNPQEYGVELTNMIQYGASPRASIYLTMAAKAHAFLNHRGFVIPDDVKAVGMEILRHRIIISYEAEAEEFSSDRIAQQLFDSIEVP
jgi:MoxR-like ATPase